MSTGLTRDTILRLADDFDLRMQDGQLFLSAELREDVRFPREVVEMLSVFHQERTFGDGIDELSRNSHAAIDFIHLTGVALSLLEIGVLVRVDGIAERREAGTPNASDWTMHISMLDDVVRTQGYIDAIMETVKPGDVVVDLGTGTGILAVAAALAGASRVYAIEMGPIAAAARTIFADCHVADRITLLRGISTRLEPPELADVLVTEIFGHDPFAEHVLEYVRDARRRWLKPEGRIIPERFRVYVRGAEVSENMRQREVFTPEAGERWSAYYGMNLQSLGHIIPTGPLFVVPQMGDQLHYLTKASTIYAGDMNDLPPWLDLHATCQATAAGPLDAAVMHFELDLGSRTITSADDADDDDCAASWHPMVWLQPQSRDLRPGDEVPMRYRYHPTGARLVVTPK
ncbi:MAG: 50S ribosomal protein L11 methyltransferase [Myxococcales bacterium]|nr:50S ribosomal protein L11 methyltransferase [Myxococcales bacterium]